MTVPPMEEKVSPILFFHRDSGGFHMKKILKVVQSLYHLYPIENKMTQNLLLLLFSIPSLWKKIAEIFIV